MRGNSCHRRLLEIDHRTAAKRCTLTFSHDNPVRLFLSSFINFTSHSSSGSRSNFNNIISVSLYFNTRLNRFYVLYYVFLVRRFCCLYKNNTYFCYLFLVASYILYFQIHLRTDSKLYVINSL